MAPSRLRLVDDQLQRQIVAAEGRGRGASWRLLVSVRKSRKGPDKMEYGYTASFLFVIDAKTGPPGRRSNNSFCRGPICPCLWTFWAVGLACCHLPDRLKSHRGVAVSALFITSQHVSSSCRWYFFVGLSSIPSVSVQILQSFRTGAWEKGESGESGGVRILVQCLVSVRLT